MISKHQFFGFLNVDDSLSNVPKGEFVNAENVRVQTGDKGKTFSVKPLPGTDQRTGYRTDHVVIGSFYDKKNNRVYFLRYEPNGEHDIKVYDRKNFVIETVLESGQVHGGLNFSLSTRITGIALIGDFLYWTDNINPPRRINVERGIKANHTSYATTVEPYSFPLRQMDITVAREQPVNPIKFLKEDSGRPNNLIDGRAFQFSYRYEFKSGELSTLAPFSKTATHNNPDSLEIYDTIKLTIPSIEELPDEVYAVQILARQGNTGSWFIAGTFDRDRNAQAMLDHDNGVAPLTLNFYNDTNSVTISDAEAYKLFDSVPLRSQALAIANNRLFLGNNLEGYSPVTTNSLTANVISETAGAGFTGEYILVESICQDDEGAITTESFIVVKVTGQGAIDGFYLTDVSPTGFQTATLPNVVTVNPQNKLGDLTLTNQDILDILSICGSQDTEIGSVDDSYAGTQPSIVGLGGFSNQDGTFVFKSNSGYKVGIVFFDEVGRNAGVFTNEALSLTTPDLTYQNTVWNTGIEWALSTGTQLEIPDWATKYAIVRTKSLSNVSFIQHYITEVTYAEKDDAGVYSFATGAINPNKVAIGIPLSNLEKDGLGYTYVEGDVCRIYKDSGETYVARITGTDGKYLLTEAIDIGNTTNEVYYIEIYTPNFNAGSELFYEVGVMHRVVNPGTTARTYSVTSGVLQGDVVVKQRSYDGGTDFVEAMNPDDKYWSQWITDIGRPNTVLQRVTQEHLHTNIRYSNTLVEGSKVNGLNSFDPLNFKPLPSEVGAIQNLIWTATTNEYGNVLLAIGENETVSIYTGRTQIFDEANTNALASSTDVIGSVNVLKGSYGTRHPESVVENKGNVYWFDAHSGSVVRYSQNGLYPISEAKMKSLYKDIALNINNVSDRFFLHGGYDQYHDEYVLFLPESVISAADRIEIFDDLKGELVFDEDVPGGNVSNINHTYPEQFKSRTHRMTVTVGDATQYDTMTVRFGFQYITFNLNLVPGETTEILFTPSDLPNDLVFELTNANGSPKHNLNVKVEELVCDYYNAFGCDAKCAVWSEKDTRWTGFHTYIPEGFSRLGDDLVSFQGGNLFVHNDVQNRNNFYGESHKARFMFLCNEYPSAIKLAKALSIESDVKPGYIHIRTLQPNEQRTDLVNSDLETTEGIHEADILRDRLSPNVTGTPDEKLFSGDLVRGDVIQCMIQYPGRTDFEVRFINLRYQISYGSQLVK